MIVTIDAILSIVCIYVAIRIKPKTMIKYIVGGKDGITQQILNERSKYTTFQKLMFSIFYTTGVILGGLLLLYVVNTNSFAANIGILLYWLAICVILGEESPYTLIYGGGILLVIIRNITTIR